MSRIQQLKNQLLQAMNDGINLTNLIDELDQAMRDDLARLDFSIAQAQEDEKQAILRMDLHREKRQYKLQLAEARFAKAQRRFEEEQRLYRYAQREAEAFEDRESDIHEYHHQRARALQNERQDLLEELNLSYLFRGLRAKHLQPDQPVLDQDDYRKLDLLRKILKKQSRNDSYDDHTLLTMYQTWRDTYQAPPRQNRYQTMLVFVQQHSEAFPPVVAEAAVAPAVSE